MTKQRPDVSAWSRYSQTCRSSPPSLVEKLFVDSKCVTLSQRKTWRDYTKECFFSTTSTILTEISVIQTRPGCPKSHATRSLSSHCLTLTYGRTALCDICSGAESHFDRKLQSGVRVCSWPHCIILSKQIEDSKDKPRLHMEIRDKVADAGPAKYLELELELEATTAAPRHATPRHATPQTWIGFYIFNDSTTAGQAPGTASRRSSPAPGPRPRNEMTTRADLRERRRRRTRTGRDGGTA